MLLTQLSLFAGLQVAQVCMFFALPKHLHHVQSIPKFLTYVEWFNPLRAPDPDSGLYSVSRSLSRGLSVASVIPIHDIVSSCYLIPKFGTKFFPAKWTHLDILDNWKHLSLNKYINLSTFYKHQDLA